MAAIWKPLRFDDWLLLAGMVRMRMGKVTRSLSASDAEELTRYGRFAITLPFSQT
jgi:hypothetical protein